MVCGYQKNGRAPGQQSAPVALQTEVCLLEGCQAGGCMMYRFFSVAGFVLLAFEMLDSGKSPLRLESWQASK